jgi:hypothetical protein
MKPRLGVKYPCEVHVLVLGKKVYWFYPPVDFLPPIVKFSRAHKEFCEGRFRLVGFLDKVPLAGIMAIKTDEMISIFNN